MLRALLVIICSTLGNHAFAEAAQSAAESMKKAPWFQGSVEDAFAKARSEQKHIFLYWGAVWCPPCNYLKSQVFDHAKFAEVMKPAVAVFLDGDSERAQSYADKFNATGYPTIIIFDSEGRERLRLDSALDFKEFESVVGAVFSDTESLREVVAKFLAGKSSDRDLALITGTSWYDINDKLYPTANHIKDRLAILDKLPSANKDARSRIASGLLLSALDIESKNELAETNKLLQAAAPKLFDTIFLNSATIHASREVIANFPKELISWKYPKPSAERSKLIDTWQAALDKINKHEGYPADIYMYAALSSVNLYKLKHTGTAVPTTLLDNVRAAVATGDKNSVTEHQRIAAVYTAAYTLGEIGAFDDARKLLDKELKTTKVPWYFQSTYASVERKAGNPEKALYWAEQARLSVEGSASKLQWIFNEIRMVDTIAPADKNTRLLTLFKIYFDHALTFSDGFVGRNSSQMKRAEKILKPLMTDKEIAAMISAYKNRCNSSAAKADCSAFFANL